MNTEVKRKIVETLERVHDDYRERGIVSIYLWGSVVSGDYDPEKSDVDALAFVSDDADEGDVSVIRRRMAEYAPEIADFHINFLYLSELKGGPIRSRLCRIMPPGYLLTKFPYWLHVVGQKFQRADFSVADFTWDEAIELNCREIFEEKVPLWKSDHPRGDEMKYVVKACMMICFCLHQKAHGEHAFSYASLRDEATEETRPIVSILDEARKRGYDKGLIEKHVTEILEFCTVQRTRSAFKRE